METLLTSLKSQRPDTNYDMDADKKNHTDDEDEEMRYNAYRFNTGPKGVRADAEGYEQERRLLNSRNAFMKAAGIRAKAQTALTFSEENSTRLNENSTDDKDGQDDRDMNEIDDQEVMRKWREKRFAELKRCMEKPRHGSPERKSRFFGQVKTVDANGYLDAVEDPERLTKHHVVVFIYDDEVLMYHFNVYG